MKKIAHRGNIYGPNFTDENKPEYIQNALDKGFYVEIDVRCINGEFWLGHNTSQYKTSYHFLNNKKFLIHAKTIETLFVFLKTDIDADVFCHDQDIAVYTKNGYIWTTNYFPSDKLIFVSPNLKISKSKNNYDCAGICGDYLL